MSPDIQKKIEMARSKGYTDAQIYAYLQKKGVQLEEPDQEEPSRTLSERIFGAAKAVTEATGLGAASERLGSAIAQGGVLKDVLMSGGDQEKLQAANERGRILSEMEQPTAKETIGSVIQGGALFAPVGTVAGAVAKGVKAAGATARAARTAGNILAGGGAGYMYDVGKGIEEGTGISPSWGTAFGVAVPAGFALKDSLLGRTVEHATSQTFRAVKPSITNKRNLRTLKGRMERANVEIVNHGYKPTNLQEYADAIDKTKQSVWKKVQAKMGQRAGDQVTLDTIASKLDSMANDPNVLRLDPRGSKKIQALSKALTSQGKRITIQDAEKLKQFVNAQLEGAYGQMNISKVEQEARKLITREIGDQLDSILSSVPNEFKELKNSYGALREIEEDVIKRIVVFERQNPAGLFDGLGSMAGIANIVRGMLTASPGAAIQGATELSMGMAIKRMNNADNLVRKAFENISKQVSPKPFFYSPGDAIMDGSVARWNKAQGGKMGMSIENVAPKLTENDRVVLADFVARTEQGKPITQALKSELDEIAGRTKMQMNTDSQSFAEHVKDILENQPVGGPLTKGAVPETALLQEARKYKTADEFVKARGAKLFHGSTEKVTEFSESSIRPTFLTKDEGYADVYTYAKDGSGKRGSVEEVYFNPRKPLDTSTDEMARKLYNEEFLPYIKEYGVDDSVYKTLSKGEKIPFTTVDDFYRFIRSQKRQGRVDYDAILVNEGKVGGDALVPLNASEIKTKSQLTDIWKKANP